MSTLVLPNDDGIRPAGEPDSCFYCNQKVGSDHKPECVALHKKVKVRYVFDIEVEVPHAWKADDISFHRNEGGWCANNAIQDLESYMAEAPCLCSVFSCEVIDANMASDPYTKQR